MLSVEDSMSAISNRLTIRLSDHDRAHLELIHDHLRMRQRFVDRTMVIRAALRIAAEAISKKSEGEV